MNNTRYSRSAQACNKKKFQCVYTQVVAEYGFAANYVLDYLFRQGKPVRFSSKRFSQFFGYACQDTYADVVIKLQAAGLIYRVVERVWDRGLRKPRSQALYGLTSKGRDFIEEEKQSRRWLNVAYADLIAFNGRVDHAYHYTLLRGNTPSEFQLTLKEIAAIIDASIKTTRTFMAYLLKHEFLIVKEESRRGVTGVYLHAFAHIPSDPNQIQTKQQCYVREMVSNKDLLELNGENTEKNSPKKQKFYKQSSRNWISKAEILALFDPTDEELIPLSKLLSMTHYQSQKGYVYWSKSLWHNVIHRFADEFVRQGFSLYHFLDACVRVMYRDKSATNTVDMTQVFRILQAEKLLGWQIPHTLEHGIPLVLGQHVPQSKDERELAYMHDAFQILEQHNISQEDIRFCLTSPYFLDNKVRQFLQLVIERKQGNYENSRFRYKHESVFTYMEEMKSLGKTVLYRDLCVKYGKNVARRLAFSYEFKAMIRFGKCVAVHDSADAVVHDSADVVLHDSADAVVPVEVCEAVPVEAGEGDMGSWYDSACEDALEADKTWRELFAQECAQREPGPLRIVKSVSLPMFMPEPVAKPKLAVPAYTAPKPKPAYQPSAPISKPASIIQAMSGFEPAYEGETEADRIAREAHLRDNKEREEYCLQGSAPTSYKKVLEEAEKGPSPDDILQEQLKLMGVGKIGLRRKGSA